MLEEIKVKREIMIDSANKNGYTSEETIKYSQELDELINEYQRTIPNSSNSNDDKSLGFIQIIMNWAKSIVEI